MRTNDYEERARSIMSGTLRLAPHKPWNTTRVADWTADPFSSRNWQFQHHALRWLSPVRFLAFDGDADARDFWFRVVQDWVAHNPPENPPSTFSWFDMTDGLRAQELVFGWPLATNDVERELLITALHTHGEWLADESHQATGNHALHQNIGLFVVASFLRARNWKRLAVARMETLFLRSFDQLGANDEGSPEYHRLNLAWWRSAWDRVAMEGVAVPEAAAFTLSRAATFLAHLTRPDGTLVPLGDTHLKHVSAEGWPELEYVATLGVVGEPPSTTVVAAPNGYVLGRSGWGDDERSFAEHSHYSIRYGNHSSSHQHEDRGSLTFFTGGQDWLTDPGSYMYEPKDPFRKYLRSREAHNLVTVEDREYVSDARVWLKACSTSDLAHDFTVQDPGYRGVVITRRVVYLPPLDLLVVLDSVSADAPITTQQRWHTEPGVKPRYRDSALELQKRNGSRFTVQWLGEGIRPRVHYGNDSSIREWVSRKWGQKEPAAGFEVSQTGRSAFYATIMGDSTRDAWAVVSSRAKSESTWLRITRFGLVWEISIDDEGVRVTLDQDYEPAPGQSSSAGRAADAVALAGVQQRLRNLEQQWAMASSRAAESTESVSALQKQFTVMMDEALAAERTRERKRTAALLSLLPQGTDPHRILGGLTLGEVAPHIEDPLYLYELWGAHAEEVPLNLGGRRRLARELYQRGYYSRSLEVLKGLSALTGKEADLQVVRVRESELSMMRGAVELVVPPVQDFTAHTGRILHVVGKALPETQTGYTLRTHYLAAAQVERGYDVHVMRQAGAVTTPHDAATVDLDEVTYHLPEGPVRSSVLWDEWLQANVDALHRLVADIRPSVLHCHSDFVNQMIAQPVARAFGIPLVYESRGFWEESWLSRIETTVGRSLDKDHERYGMPEAYTLRQAREDDARRGSDRVTTLADVMREHIVARGLDGDLVTVTPNGVEPSEFPVITVNQELKARLGIPANAMVIGYITSVVEYEGIDTLVRAFAQLRETGEDAWLLIVGDGPVKKSLEKLAQNLGVADHSTFTGRIPHEEVLDYYSVIDLFVVPRKNRAVCRLVTPLKPFEAFSTGRTVVLSDVDALREIAQDSDAAELFQAGNADSLAACLRSLMHDDARRSELAARGAQWAREHRSWDAIATIYDRPYGQLGIVPFVPLQSRDTISNEETHNYRGALACSSRDEAIRFIGVHNETRKNDPVREADIIRREGWGGHGFPSQPVPRTSEWNNLASQDRTWQMHLHSWEFMTPVLEAWARTGDTSYLQWAVDVALEWIEEHPVVDFSIMAWYDMALAYRSVNLQALVLAAAGTDLVGDDQFRSLLRLCLVHRDAHWRAESFNARNNHGYYSAVSQLVLGRALRVLPGMQALQAQGTDRLRHMVGTQFLPDGGHAEHSPDYHRMLLASFEGAIRAGAIDDPEVLTRVRRAADVLGWMILPTGTILQMGDSPERMMSSGQRSMSPTTDWILSRGKRGHRPEATSLLLPDSGYAFVRQLSSEHPTTENASYLAMTAAFHSRTHKQCDDQSLVWFENGQEILIDGGRYKYGELLPQDSELRESGFYYSDPIRQYMESCPAHNTVSVDGPLHDRRRSAYGAGIQSLTRSDSGEFTIVSSVPHSFWTSTRTVIYHPGTSLTIRDEVKAHDDRDHTLFTWFLLDGSLRVVTTESGIVVSSPHWAHDMTVTRSTTAGEQLKIWSDEREPAIRGVRSRQDRVVEPCWSVGYSAPFKGMARTQTTFTFQTTENGVS
ncbi:heparinase II/III family protein [Kocuria sp.]|uniref:heparinase II/III domain-containing protein n=1 Tax=Kocuria sp. TaxID=1871328 RepID=UPI002896B9D7|nr:heparinase II/III family protein [Kocuria sp.]